MPDVEIRPLSDEHLDAAEPLLARDVDDRAQLASEASAFRPTFVRLYRHIP
jgi:hypothetical protein